MPSQLSPQPYREAVGSRLTSTQAGPFFCPWHLECCTVAAPRSPCPRFCPLLFGQTRRKRMKPGATELTQQTPTPSMSASKQTDQKKRRSVLSVLSRPQLNERAAAYRLQPAGLTKARIVDAILLHEKTAGAAEVFECLHLAKPTVLRSELSMLDGRAPELEQGRKLPLIHKLAAYKCPGLFSSKLSSHREASTVGPCHACTVEVVSWHGAASLHILDFPVLAPCRRSPSLSRAPKEWRTMDQASARQSRSLAAGSRRQKSKQSCSAMRPTCLMYPSARQTTFHNHAWHRLRTTKRGPRAVRESPTPC